MTRQKTISDEDLLAVARKVFREHGHVAPTREIARQAGISEGVLYQRFGSKEGLFFAAMVPREPDFELLLGPNPPQGDPRAFLHDTLKRMAAHFSEVIPLALQVITHPSSGRFSFEHAGTGLAHLRKALGVRLQWFEGQGRIRRATAAPTAQLLLSLAHDWAISHVPHGPHGHPVGAARNSHRREKELEEMADIVWQGIRPTKAD